MPTGEFRPLRSWIIGAVLLAAALGSAKTQTPGETDLWSQLLAEKLASHGARVVVMIFAATDCPISNRYIPEIARLDEEFAPKNVAFWWVFPNSSDSQEVVDKHYREFALKEHALLDSDQRTVRWAHVSVTPEAAVFVVKNGALEELYHGRIDDRYAAFGVERPQPAKHDLEQVIEAVLAGRSPQAPQKGPIGCAIVPVTRKP